MTQRQLKFRAWDTVTQKFIESGFHFFGEVAAFEIVENYVRENNPNNTDFLLRLNDVVIQQLTGLQDKEKNDIYEGDILRIRIDFDDDEDPTWELAPITWLSGGFYLDNYWAEPLHDFIGTGDGLVEGEVVGNIFENSELLEKI